MVGVQAGEGKRAERESQREQAHGRHRLVDDGHHAIASAGPMKATVCIVFRTRVTSIPL